MKNWIHDNHSDIILNSKVKLYRNLKNLSFPNKLNSIVAIEKSRSIYDILVKEIEHNDLELYEVWNGKKEFYNEYIEKDLGSTDELKNPDKVSVIINNNETINIVMNNTNHIEIECITADFNIQEAFQEAMKLDNKIEENFCYAYDDELGYLTSSLDIVGTAMKISVIMNLPALKMSEEIKNISKSLEEEGFKIISIYKDENEPLGNLYEIINKTTLGISEEDIVNNLEKVVLRIMKKELDLREIMMSKCKIEIEDKVFRAYAILKSARILDFKEAVELLSNVRLGCELSLLNIEKSKINQLQVIIGDSYLQNYFSKQLDSKEIKYERANLVKKILA